MDGIRSSSVSGGSNVGVSGIGGVVRGRHVGGGRTAFLRRRRQFRFGGRNCSGRRRGRQYFAFLLVLLPPLLIFKLADFSFNLRLEFVRSPLELVQSFSDLLGNDRQLLRPEQQQGQNKQHNRIGKTHLSIIAKPLGSGNADTNLTNSGLCLAALHFPAKDIPTLEQAVSIPIGGFTMAGLKFDNSMPRVLSSKTHSMIDYMHVATNLVAARFSGSTTRAVAGAFILGGSVLANSLMTAYELGVFRLYSFKVHGILDYAVAASSAAMPAIMGFTNKRQAKYFYAQGGGESLIAGISDYDDSGTTRTGMRLDDRARLSDVA